jgi:hypothetical protein
MQLFPYATKRGCSEMPPVAADRDPKRLKSAMFSIKARADASQV